MLFRPHTDTTLYGKDGELELNSTNFPSCVFALRTEDITGEDAVGDSREWCIDPINGNKYRMGTAVSGSFTLNGDGTFNASDNPLVITNGTFEDPAANDTMIVIVVGDVADNSGLSLGDAVSGPGVGVTTNGSADTDTTGYVTFDASNYHTLPNLALTSVSGCMITTADTSSNNATELYAYDTTTDTYETSSGAATLTIEQTWTFQGSNNIINFKGASNIYGIYILYFTTAPSAAECQAAVSWMAENPTKGIYPVWKGRT